MADYVVTASSVVPGTGCQKQQFTAGVAITAGQPFYVDGSNLAQLAKGDSAIHSAVIGIALSNAAANQPFFGATGGPVTFNAIFTQGGTVVLSSATAGSMAPDADITTGGFKTILGVALSTTSLQLGFNPSGVAHG